MCGGFNCSRNALAALNVLYILVAFILIGAAGYAKGMAIVSSLTIVGGVIASGVFLLLIAIIGLIGAVKHHQVCLFFYMIILFLLFLLEFGVSCACLALSAEQQQEMAEAFWKGSNRETKKDIQKNFNCCGYKDMDNINVTDVVGHPPCGENGSNIDECNKYQNAICCSGIATGTSDCPCKVTCHERMKDNMNNALKIAGGVGLFFSFTEIVGVWLSLRFRNMKDPRANPNAFL